MVFGAVIFNIMFQLKKKEIQIGGKKIEYLLRLNDRARNIRLTVRPRKLLLVSCPKNIKESIVEDFLVKKTSWIIKKLDLVKTFSYRNKSKYTRKNFLAKKKNALDLIRERVEYFNKFYHYEYKAISVGNQKTRWGSCSKNRNLNFNYKLIFLPSEIRDYIVVHELCHLKEFNHSPEFWKLVSQTTPQYFLLRKKLRNIIF